jgi:hypothetical protein
MAAAAGMTFAASSAMAVDISVVPLKLIIVDKIVASGTAKAVFVVKDPAVTKGPGTNVAAISSQLDVSYDATSGSFVNPSGSNWLVNKDTVAKYVNKTAPTGGSTKVSVIKPGKLIKNVGKSLGDTPIDISTAPSGPVKVTYTVSNGATFRHCGQFTGAGCSHKSIAGGTGFKLVCKGNGLGATCPASPSGAFVD